MNRLRKLVTFNLDGGRFALSLSFVERIIRVVDVTPLPKAPKIVAGIIDLQGRIVPVIDVRACFGLRARTVRLSDQMIIASVAKGVVALLVDTVDDVIEVPEEKVSSVQEVLPETDCVQGVVKTENGMIFIHDLETILSFQEEKGMIEAIEALNGDAP